MSQEIKKINKRKTDFPEAQAPQEKKKKSPPPPPQRLPEVPEVSDTKSETIAPLASLNRPGTPVEMLSALISPPGVSVSKAEFKVLLILAYNSVARYAEEGEDGLTILECTKNPKTINSWDEHNVLNMLKRITPEKVSSLFSNQIPKKKGPREALKIEASAVINKFRAYFEKYLGWEAADFDSSNWGVPRPFSRKVGREVSIEEARTLRRLRRLRGPEPREQKIATPSALSREAIVIEEKSSASSLSSRLETKQLCPSFVTGSSSSAMSIGTASFNNDVYIPPSLESEVVSKLQKLQAELRIKEESTHNFLTYLEAQINSGKAMLLQYERKLRDIQAQIIQMDQNDWPMPMPMLKHLLLEEQHKLTQNIDVVNAQILLFERSFKNCSASLLAVFEGLTRTTPQNILQHIQEAPLASEPTSLSFLSNSSSSTGSQLCLSHNLSLSDNKNQSTISSPSSLKSDVGRSAFTLFSQKKNQSTAQEVTFIPTNVEPDPDVIVIAQRKDTR